MAVGKTFQGVEFAPVVLSDFDQVLLPHFNLNVLLSASRALFFFDTAFFRLRNLSAHHLHSS